MALAGTVPQLVTTILVFSPFAVQCFVVLHFFLPPYQIVARASAIRGEGAALVIADGAAGRLV